MGDEEQAATRVVAWITYDDCMERYGVNPIGRTDIRSKLAHRSEGQFVRVWLEDDVKEKGTKP